jgi:hypothetical protein
MKDSQAEWRQASSLSMSRSLYRKSLLPVLYGGSM